jgi:hypothetical protein
MRTDRSSRAWMRPMAGFLLSIFTCAILTATQQGNQVAAGAAAEIGQKVPGRSGGSERPRTDDLGHVTVEDPVLARQEHIQRKLRFDKMKELAAELAEMARSLQKDLEKSNPNILSVGITEKARKIEKLAGKIRNESRF